MEIVTGEIVKYQFPEPKEGGLKEVIGRIERITDTHVFIVTDSRVMLRISYKNFDYITPLNK